MKNISATLRIEKNKLASAYPWVPLFKFTFPSPVGNIFLVGNNEDVTYQSQVYTAFDIDVELPSEQTSSKVPECTIKAANQSRAFENMIILTSGGVDSLVTIIVVNTNNLGDDYSLLTWQFYILQTTCSNQDVAMTCSLYSPMDMRFPPDRYFGTTCRYQYYKGIECKWGGPQSSCDRSITTCRTYGNQINFGGFPGIHDSNIAFLFSRKI